MRVRGVLWLGLWATLAHACVDLARPVRVDSIEADAKPELKPEVTPPAEPGREAGVPEVEPGEVGEEAGGEGGTGGGGGELGTGGAGGSAPDVPMEVAPEVMMPKPDTAPPVDLPALKPNGAACLGPSACQSGFCVDGVCCEGVCNGICFTCNGTIPGKCQAAPAGQDPGNDCTAAPIGSCGFDGSCDGAGACRREAAGTTCVAGVCTGSTETARSTCDGAGTCRPGAVRECAPYLCGGNACRTSCTAATDCKAGYACQANQCVIPTTPDAGTPDMAPPPTDPVLLVDDFSDGTLTRNTMGGVVTWDNQDVALVNGQVRFRYSGSGGYHDFIETFLGSFCAYDIRMYRTLRFKMRATSPRNVRIFMARSNSNCATASTPLINTVSVTTTMATYTVDISAVVRDKAIFVEFSPTTEDSTDYFLDDIELLP